ncbi:MAG: DUF2141 domain-containing protein [Alphaproteobacteria bacterium]|nr:DUF2141 domain-containing protein [Alphaproteobacteria bacterium]
MRTQVATAWLLTAGLGSAPAWAGTLVVQVHGVATTDGQLLVALYDAAHADAYPTRPDAAVLKDVVAPVVPVTTLTFLDVPDGTYAAVVVHDVNGNGDLDTRPIFPIPTEPIGASRDAKGRFGPPKFRDARFAVAGPRTEEKLTLTAL